MQDEAVKAASTVHALAKYYFDKGKYSEAERIFRSMADGERKSATSSQAELAQLAHLVAQRRLGLLVGCDGVRDDPLEVRLHHGGGHDRL